MAKGLLGKIGAQFGLGSSEEEDQPSSPISEYTPDQIRAADLELQAAARGKRVTVMQDKASDPLPDDASNVSGDAVDSAGNLNLSVLYAQAGVPSAKFTAEQALDMINDCEPTDAARKQTIKMITIFGKNVGATPDEIVVDAVGKQDALDAFNNQHGSDLIEFQAKIKEKRELLQQQLAHLDEVEQQAEQQYQAVREACVTEHSRLERVRDFFRTEVPPTALTGATPSVA
jgi:hypothetical protein